MVSNEKMKFLKYSNSEFDEHFEILTLLTNELIRMQSLEDNDATIYRAMLQEYQHKHLQRKIKKKASAERSCIRKRNRLTQLNL